MFFDLPIEEKVKLSMKKEMGEWHLLGALFTLSHYL